MSNLYDDEYEGVFSVLLVRHRGVACFPNVFQVSDSNGTEKGEQAHKIPNAHNPFTRCNTKG